MPPLPPYRCLYCEFFTLSTSGRISSGTCRGEVDIRIRRTIFVIDKGSYNPADLDKDWECEKFELKIY